MNSTWTAAADAQLAKMISEGQSASYVATVMGLTRNAVMGRAYRKALQFKSKAVKPRKLHQKQRDIARFTATEDKIIIGMAAAGKSGLDIAEGIGRRKSSVVKRAHRLGAKLNGKDGPKPSAEPKTPTVKAKKVKLQPRNIANKRESRTNDPVFRHVTPSVPLRPLMVALVDLQANDCRFPCGDPREEGFGFCGLPKDDGSAYCKAHRRLCHTAPEDRRRAA